MEILKNFGFEPILFLAQIINFLIIFFVLKKFLYKPILKILDERKRQIDEGIKNAQESNKLLEETINKEEEILKKAQAEAKKLIEEAKVKHDAILAKSEEAAKQRVEKMQADAKENINAQAAEVEKRIAVNVSKIASKMLTESLKGFFDAQDQEQIIKSAIKKIKETS